MLDKYIDAKPLEREEAMDINDMTERQLVEYLKVVIPYTTHSEAKDVANALEKIGLNLRYEPKVGDAISHKEHLDACPLGTVVLFKKMLLFKVSDLGWVSAPNDVPLFSDKIANNLQMHMTSVTVMYVPEWAEIKEEKS